MLLQIRDAWVEASRLRALGCGADTAVFSNVQLEGYVRAIQTNRVRSKPWYWSTSSSKDVSVAPAAAAGYKGSIAASAPLFAATCAAAAVGTPSLLFFSWGVSSTQEINNVKARMAEEQQELQQQQLDEQQQLEQQQQQQQMLLFPGDEALKGETCETTNPKVLPFRV